MAEFFAMGGHGFYVWTSYFFAFIVLGWVYFQPLRVLRKFKQASQSSRQSCRQSHAKKSQ